MRTDQMRQKTVLKFLYVLNSMRTQLLSDTLVTKRGIYYLLEDNFTNQSEADRFLSQSSTSVKTGDL